MSLNRAIGLAGRIPWHLPEDFRWFKQCTLGQTIVMGRKTWDSLGKPLPGRHHVVITRRGPIPGIETLASPDVLEPSRYAPREIWIIGGAEIYRQLLPRCTDLYLTLVLRETAGDTFFPDFENTFAPPQTIAQHPGFRILHYRKP